MFHRWSQYVRTIEQRYGNVRVKRESAIVPRVLDLRHNAYLGCLDESREADKPRRCSPARSTRSCWHNLIPVGVRGHTERISRLCCTAQLFLLFSHLVICRNLVEDKGCKWQCPTSQLSVGCPSILYARLCARIG